jgi:zinc D-Ala-D-Ala dipeptidase
MPGHRLSIYDAYRPLTVQSFMVHAELKRKMAQLFGKSIGSAKKGEYAIALAETYKLWAPPDSDPASPPPHSTGGAIDLTIVDALGNPLNMGSQIDQAKNAEPDSFAHSVNECEKAIHANRILLRDIMEDSGFAQLEHEWWHFSIGDQYWALSIARKFLARTNALIEPRAHY